MGAWVGHDGRRAWGSRAAHNSTTPARRWAYDLHPVFGVIHPLLLWGLAAVAVPIAIHLLLRQRPRPRPWAAMRWLQAAAQAATRRWKLTNWLLLLLRMLILALLALAVARPTLGLAGGGERLVLVLDRSASMGPGSDSPGPLAQAAATLGPRLGEWRSVTLVAVDGRGAELIADGNPATVRDALARLAAAPVPGGLDGALAIGSGSAALDAATSASDVLLVSDFQQDRGEALLAAFTGRCRRAGRWLAAPARANAYVTGPVPAMDLQAGTPGEATVPVAGSATGAALAVNDGPFLPAAAGISGGAVRVAVPPLAAGAHRLRLRLEDRSGPAYDDLLELPVAVRGPVAALAVRAQGDWLTAALAADAQAVSCTALEPARLAGTPLPEGGLVALRAPSPDSARLAAWVAGGGVLWTSYELLARDAALRPMLDTLELTGDAPGGAFATGDRAVDEVLGLAAAARVPAATLPVTATVLLRAGGSPIVVAIPTGRGWVVVELSRLSEDAAFQARGTVPAWVLRTTRQLTAAATAPRQLEAGTVASAALALTRAGREVTISDAAPILLEPGVWTSADGPVLVLPSRDEGRTDGAVPPGVASDVGQALPGRGGRELGWWLLLAALAVALIEGALAAWAGRAYGR